MTIKEFARLCGCNPQTLRYYDHVDLLKPVKVDQWSGYRFYEEEQALAFVKIKNLQKAGFTIEEIKELLDKDNHVIYKAFDAKIAEEEKRLQEIKAIQKSYQTEMTDMKKKLETMRDMVKESMEAYDPSEEFGIDRDTYSHMIESVNGFFESMISRSDDSDFEYSEYSESDESVEEPEYVNLLNNPDYEVVYEKHGWSFVKEFFSEFSTGPVDNPSIPGTCGNRWTSIPIFHTPVWSRNPLSFNSFRSLSTNFFSTAPTTEKYNSLCFCTAHYSFCRQKERNTAHEIFL